MAYIYIDLNVFNKLEDLDTLNFNEKEVYTFLDYYLRSGECLALYSPAHVSDLIRGLKNNPSESKKFIEGHLANIQSYTGDLCISQYWNKESVQIHERDIFEYFDAEKNEEEIDMSSYENLLLSQFDDLDDSARELASAKNLIVSQINLFKTMPLPEGFEDASKYPTYRKMFPKAIESRNFLSLLDDILALQQKMRDDPILYKELKQMMNPLQIQDLSKFFPQEHIPDRKELRKTMKAVNMDVIIDKNTSRNKTSKNPWYDKIISAYTKYDLKGFKTDEQFSNMIDDSNHTFYAAHCKYFLTLDDKCHYKASKVYSELGIATKVMKPKQFFEVMK